MSQVLIRSERTINASKKKRKLSVNELNTICKVIDTRGKIQSWSNDPSGKINLRKLKSKQEPLVMMRSISKISYGPSCGATSNMFGKLFDL